ncbi:outer membrane beta-barrel protein [Chitiniphilus eburneus]|uniref:Outer membrane beta-barrel protein n=1 Tax=Chitiniphilus eburneus TaxID=2571148 RepID=A0A4V5MPB0_9NEIS|nr:outer membrane beta-barrel protein [Chitiniphilus eburneus]TJZ67998.1 hypothetical protein FAZ21_15985 [Chitiniphilus eburneus]
MMLCAAMLPAAHAAYDESDAVVLEARLRYRYDDNLFRLPDAADAGVVLGDTQRGDHLIEPRVGVKAQWPVSRQLFTFNGEVFAPHYLHYDELDYTGWDGEAAWQWAVGSNVGGRLSYGDRKSLSSFEDVLGGIKDLYRTRTAEASGNWQIGPTWSLGASIGGTEERHEARQYQDYDEHHVAVGVTAQTGKGSTFTLRGTMSELEYVENLGFISADQRGYRQHGVDFAWQIPVTGLTRFGGSIGWVSWKDKAGGEATDNFIGGINAQWQATERTSVELAYERAFDDPGQNLVRRITDTYRIRADWRYHPKWIFTGEVRYEDREIARDTLGDIQDQTLYWRLASTFRPTNAIDLIAYVEQQGRDSNVPSNEYDSMQYGLTANWRF